jgi:hypothetical protein
MMQEMLTFPRTPLRALFPLLAECFEIDGGGAIAPSKKGSKRKSKSQQTPAKPPNQGSGGTKR